MRLKGWALLQKTPKHTINYEICFVCKKEKKPPARQPERPEQISENMIRM